MLLVRGIWLFTAVALGAACGDVIKQNPGGEVDGAPDPDAPGVDAPPAEPTLFWVERDAACDASAIRRLPAGSSVPEDVLSLPGPDSIADVAIEDAASRAYFSFGQSSANQTETVERVNLDGSGRQAIKTYAMRPTPLGVTIDGDNDAVYWLTNGGCSPCPSCGPCSTLESSRRDGTANTTVHTLTGTANPRMVALDSTSRKLYFCDLQFRPQIQRVDLDGSNLEPVFDVDGEAGADDIELDVDAGKIYWLEATTEIGVARSIFRSNLDGTNLEVLGTAGGTQDTTPRGIAVDTIDKKIYWTESGFCGGDAPGRIRRSDLDGTNVETVVDGLGLLTSIEISR